MALEWEAPAIIMEHHGGLFDIDDAKNNVVTLHCC